MSKILDIYHPFNRSDKNEWLLCHASLGAKDYSELSEPRNFNEQIAPAWYRKANPNALEKVWEAQEVYTQKLLEWIDRKTIIKAYIAGADERRERDALSPYGVVADGYFAWNSRVVEIMPTLNLYNLYLEAKDGSGLIIFESETETLFIKDPHASLPTDLRKPQIIL